MIKIARIALALGLLTSASSLAYASGLVMNDNELRNDLACFPIAALFISACRPGL